MLPFLLEIGLTLIADLFPLGGMPSVVEHDGPYEKIALTDSTTIELYQSDTITVVFTACAPQCSSRARIYNKEWVLLGDIPAPVTSIFPLATMDPKTGRIEWTDNDTWEY